jgi:nonsense-mediated mRNA decay protein 3
MNRSDGLRQAICPVCGGPVDDTGTCIPCRIRTTRWFWCDPKTERIRCPACGASKEAGIWMDQLEERSVQAEEMVLRAVHFHPDLRNPRVETRILHQSSNRSVAELAIRGVLYGRPVEGECRVALAWVREQCDRCNRLSGDYYEGVVQVRAEGRKPYAGEVAMTREIACAVEERMQSGGERLSFVSRIDEGKDGLDITVGSQQIGLAISQQIVEQLGGRFTTHPKLVGEKAGRRLYRITFSIRLPRLTRGDVVERGEGYAEVLAPEGRSVRYRDLSTGAIRSARPEALGRRIGSISEPEQALVAYTDGKIIGIIDPMNGKTIELPASGRKIPEPGSAVRILRDRDRILLVGTS